MIKDSIPAIQRLSPQDRLSLALELCTEVSDDGQLTPADAALLDSRLAEFASSPTVRTTEQVTAGIAVIRAKLARLRQQ